MKSKKLLAAVAAIAVLTTSTGVYAFANNQAESKQDAGESTTIVTETEETEDEAEDDTVVEDEVTEDEVVEDEVVEDEVVEDSETDDAEDAEKPETDAEAPKKHIGIKEMVKNTFDLEAQDFVDDEAKAEWFDYCANHLLAEPVKPEPPVADDAEKPVPPVVDDAEKPVPPVVDETEKPEPPVKPVSVKELAKSVFDLEAQDFVDDDAKAAWFEYCVNTLLAEPVKPEAPVKSEEDGTKPEPPVVDETTKPEPPVKPEDDGTKPEPPVKPEAPVAPVKPEPPADAPIPPHLRDEAKDEVSDDETADEEIVEDEVTEEA